MEEKHYNFGKNESINDIKERYPGDRKVDVALAFAQSAGKMHGGLIPFIIGTMTGLEFETKQQLAQYAANAFNQDQLEIMTVACISHEAGININKYEQNIEGLKKFTEDVAEAIKK